MRELPYRLITGKKIPDAQNEAVDIAIRNQRNLILCEDDFTATAGEWSAMLEAPEVAVCHAYTGDGRNFNARHRRGVLYFTGMVFVKIALSVIQAYKGEALFKPYGGESSGSDYHFWTRLREVVPEVDIRECGVVTHYRHQYYDDKFAASKIVAMPSLEDIHTV